MTLIWLAAAVGFIVWSFYAREQALSPVTVYRIAQEIPLNSKIGLSDFVEVEVPGDAATPDMITDPEEVVELGLHASTRLLPGQYAVKGMFVTVDNVDPFETIDLTGLRQVTIPAGYVDALGGNIRRGDTIDLVYVGSGFKQDGGVNDEYIYARTFAQDVLVHSVTTNKGFRYEPTTDRLEGQAVARTEEELEQVEGVNTGDIAHVTLAVDSALAEEINARLAKGEIRIIGRFNESETSDTTGFVIGEFDRSFTGQGNPETNQ